MATGVIGQTLILCGFWPKGISGFRSHHTRRSAELGPSSKADANFETGDSSSSTFGGASTPAPTPLSWGSSQEPLNFIGQVRVVKRLREGIIGAKQAGDPQDVAIA